MLSSIRESLTARGALHGVRIGIGLVLGRTLRTSRWRYSRPAGAGQRALSWSVDHRRMARALEAAGLQVYAGKSSDARPRRRKLARGFFQTRPDILLDDGAELIRMAHRDHPDLVEDMLGAAEETTSGVQALPRHARQGAVKISVIAVNRARGPSTSSTTSMAQDNPA